MNAKFGVSGLVVLFSLATATLYAADEGDAASESVKAHYRHADRDGSSAGRPGNPSTVMRAVKIVMLDTARYEPSSIYVNRGETVRFVVKNKDKIAHEFHIDGIAQHDEAKADMQHEDPRVVIVAPGQTKDLVWQFMRRGTFEIGCHIDGHYRDGMKMTVTAAN